MRATFVPPLASTTYVPATAAGTANAIQVTLTALVSNDVYERDIFRAGGRLEVWTDVPSGEGVANGNAAGQRGWRAVAFAECTDDEDATADVNAPGGDQAQAHDGGVPILRLTPSSPTSPASPSEHPDPEPRASHTFRATLLIPRVPPWRYAFTYRVVFPSHTRWLGTVETNGCLEVCERDLGFAEAADGEVGGWKAENRKGVGERKWVAASEDVARKEVTLGMLDVKAWTWKGWAVNEAGRITFFSLDEKHKQSGVTHASLIFLAPSSQQPLISASNELPPQSLVSPRPFVFSTHTSTTTSSAVNSSSSEASSPVSCLNVSPQGVVSLSLKNAQSTKPDVNNPTNLFVTVERRTHDHASDVDNQALVDSVQYASSNALEALEMRSVDAKSGLGRGFAVYVARQQHGGALETSANSPPVTLEAESGTAEIYVLPMTPHYSSPSPEDKVQGQTLQVALSLRDLVRACNWRHGSDPSLGCLYCHETDDTFIFDDLDKQDVDVRVLAGGEGGRFIVCSMYELGEVKGGDASAGVVRVGVLSIAGKPEVIVTRSLPTPPASPPPRVTSFAQGKKDGTTTPRSPTPARNRPLETPRPVVKSRQSSTVVLSTQPSLRDELSYHIRNLFSAHPNGYASARCTTLSRHWHSHLHLPARIFAAFSLMTWVVRVVLMGMWGVMKTPPVLAGRGASWVCSLGLRVVTGGRFGGGGSATKKKGKEREVEMAEKGEKKPMIKRPDTPPNVDTDPAGAEPAGLAMQEKTTTTTAKDTHSAMSNQPPAEPTSSAPPAPSTPKPSSSPSAHIKPGKSLRWLLPSDASISVPSNPDLKADKKDKKISLLLFTPGFAGLSGSGDTDGRYDYDVFLSRLYVEVNGREAARVGTKVVEKGMTMVSYAPPTPPAQSGYVAGTGAGGVGGEGGGSLAANSLIVRMD